MQAHWPQKSTAELPTVKARLRDLLSFSTGTSVRGAVLGPGNHSLRTNHWDHYGQLPLLASSSPRAKLRVETCKGLHPLRGSFCRHGSHRQKVLSKEATFLLWFLHGDDANLSLRGCSSSTLHPLWCYQSLLLCRLP